MRRDEIREKGPAHKALMYKTRFIWLKNPWNLTETQALRLGELERLNLKINRAYLLKELFRHFWDYRRAGWARRYLKKWFWWATHSRLAPIRDFAWMLRRHQDDLLNYFQMPIQALGWTGREAEWIALVCLHSGVFTRPQFCHYFDTQRMTASRFVKALVARRAGVESDHVTVNGGGRTCRISGKAIYRALGVENIRHRRNAGTPVVMRRLLSLDFVLEHPGLNWLPTEGEKVEFIEGLGVHSNLIPRRIYYGAVRAQKRYFALKLPVAGGARTVTFAYVDPGRENTAELNTWGAAHGPLWDAIRAQGRRVEVIAIGAELDMVLRADRVLQLWAAAEPGKVAAGLTVKQEISAISDAIDNRDMEFLAQYGGMGEAGKRYMALRKLPEAELAEGVSIDGYSTYRATRFSEPV